MKWKNFIYQGEAYDLSHLHPFIWTYSRQAKDGKPEERFHCKIQFGLHTFTRKVENDTETDPALLYSDSRETRQFCFERHKLSIGLLDIVCSIDTRRCYHTGHGNFFTVDLQEEDGQVKHYEVYFKISRSKQRGVLNLYLESAYLREKQLHKPHRRKKIGFFVIAHKTMMKQPIKAPK